MPNRIYRSKNDVKIAGVCAGIAEYYDVDPTLVRLSVTFSALLTVIMPLVILYIAAWIIIPIQD